MFLSESVKSSAFARRRDEPLPAGRHLSARGGAAGRIDGSYAATSGGPRAWFDKRCAGLTPATQSHEPRPVVPALWPGTTTPGQRSGTTIATLCVENLRSPTRLRGSVADHESAVRVVQHGDRARASLAARTFERVAAPGPAEQLGPEEALGLRRGSSASLAAASSRWCSQAEPRRFVGAGTTIPRLCCHEKGPVTPRKSCTSPGPSFIAHAEPSAHDVSG